MAAAELLETPGAADLLLARAMLDEETMKAREVNSQIYKQLFGNGWVIYVGAIHHLVLRCPNSQYPPRKFLTTLRQSTFPVTSSLCYQYSWCLPWCVLESYLDTSNGYDL